MDSEIPAISRTKTSLRVDDLICPRCSVQATSEANTVCPLCSALGKSVDPLSENNIWADIRFGGICAKRFILGLNV